jgi:hypothetical protein
MIWPLIPIAFMLGVLLERSRLRRRVEAREATLAATAAQGRLMLARFVEAERANEREALELGEANLREMLAAAEAHDARALMDIAIRLNRELVESRKIGSVAAFVTFEAARERLMWWRYGRWLDTPEGRRSGAERFGMP